MQRPPRSFVFDTWPRTAARHPWWVLGATALALAALVFAYSVFHGSYSDAFSMKGTEAQQAVDLLQARFPQQAGDSATVVVRAPAGVNDPATRAKVAGLIAQLKALPDVVDVTSPYGGQNTTSSDGTVARITVQYAKKARDLPPGAASALLALRQQVSTPSFQVEAGGPVVASAERGSLGNLTELIGISVAILVLLVAFGSVVAMGLPIITAVVALVSGLLVIGVGTRFVGLPSFTPQFGAMIGLGVGIDYALLIVTRYREGLARGLSIDNAIVQASATAGRSVLFAGSTVVIAMLGLWAVGIRFVADLGTAAAVIVALSVAVALFVMPAILKVVGHNIDRWQVPGLRVTANEGESGFGYRLSRMIQRVPVPALVVSLALLVTLSIPLFSIQLGSSDAGNNPTSYSSRRAYDLLSAGFGPGFNGPIIVALRMDTAAGAAAVSALPAELASLPGVKAASAPRFNADRSAAIITVTPTTSPQNAATATLVHNLRKALALDTAGKGTQAFVGGTTAAFIDIGSQIAGRLPILFISVIGLSFLLLMAVFRSVLVPLKAALMNLLAIGSAYGVLVAVFQWGWGAGLIGVTRTGPIESFLPMFMFAILFGLSMDYEVFLVSRIREEYLRTGDASGAVARGLSLTTRLITAAAAIMVAVFLSFALGDQRVIKEFGIGLAAAIFIDATVVRLILVPAFMQVMGDANWWFPDWLDRLVPRISIEAHHATPEPVPVRTDA
ncbi:MAG TPA: MMPL family transporter [Dehalococcoidia bacterium]|nr:MMPL family transporter [Dehalococcoidia bacterium]